MGVKEIADGRPTSNIKQQIKKPISNINKYFIVSKKENLTNLVAYVNQRVMGKFQIYGFMGSNHTQSCYDSCRDRTELVLLSIT